MSKLLKEITELTDYYKEQGFDGKDALNAASAQIREREEREREEREREREREEREREREERERERSLEIRKMEHDEKMKGISQGEFSPLSLFILIFSLITLLSNSWNI
jgi:septal ring factor EnvC (AmiA/AmiB activator)